MQYDIDTFAFALVWMSYTKNQSTIKLYQFGIKPVHVSIWWSNIAFTFYLCSMSLFQTLTCFSLRVGWICLFSSLAIVFVGKEMDLMPNHKKTIPFSVFRPKLNFVIVTNSRHEFNPFSISWNNNDNKKKYKIIINCEQNQN